MFNFYNFLIEQLDVDKLKHLEHPEDHIIHAGEEGYHHAINTLNTVHDHIKNKQENKDLKLTTKYDGSPSIVFGHHPETGKFFVATKSAFNTNPKINYTHDDIERNHGHAPGLVEKLKAALTHLPKIAPKEGVYQGDLMYTHDDIKDHGGSVHFTPNTITYSADKNSKEGKKISNSKLGLVVHTKYNGSNFDNMKAGFNVDHDSFNHHNDVHNISPEVNIKSAKITPEQSKSFESHINAAKKVHEELKGDGYASVEPHQANLKLYINDTVRNSTKPSTEGYKEFLKKRGEKEASKVKTDTTKAAKIKAHQDLIDHVNNNEKHISNVLKLHNHITKAKDVLVDSLSSTSDYHHTVDGKQTRPEGFVATVNGRPSKLVDRGPQGFSMANFNRVR